MVQKWHPVLVPITYSIPSTPKTLNMPETPGTPVPQKLPVYSVTYLPNPPNANKLDFFNSGIIDK